MTSMELYYDETKHTSTGSSVIVEDNKIFQVIEKVNDIHSREQLDKIIEHLTVTKGYVLDSDTNKFIVLKNPTEPEITYTLDMMGPHITKFEKKFLGNVE
jgi:hypothetical protein